MNMSGVNRWKLAVPGLTLSFLPAAGTGVGQQVFLVVCALMFLSMTVAWASLDLWPSEARRETAEEKPRSERNARGFGGAAGLVGLIIALGVLFYRLDINQGFPAWGSLPFIGKALLLAFTVLVTSVTAGLLVINFMAWWHRYWSALARVHYLVVTLAWVAMILVIYFWNWIGVPI